MCIPFKVQPRSSRSSFSGEFQGSIKVNLKAPPVDDAANTECRKLIAKIMGVPPSRVRIVAGHASRTKKIGIEGIKLAEAMEKLRDILPDVEFSS
ncbi:DUF167 domain-containing protein [Prosthecochloris sp. HL-130-GSB]|uniref:DUF167 domain-containing protein n=1 Tax=Prosthecochloris sp. HL-130-GSB TaxID=1974213 RepID=UPI003514E32E